MSIKFLSCIFSCFFFLFLQAADHKPQAQKRIESFGGLVGLMKEKHDAQKQQHVNFELPVRKGPRIDGDPNQKKDKKEVS
jgi:hypothetical protein